MKKILMTIVALICLAVTASAQTVYISNGDGAVAYHKNKSCSYLTKSKDIKSVSTAEAKKLGRHECPRCYGKATTAAKKTTATAKKATTTTKKATTPARDEKGRFVKKTDTAKKTTTTTKKATTTKKTTTTKKATEKKATEKKDSKKSTPARDEKGRFIKKAA